MKPQRTDRLNSLLREVISDVIRKEVKNPKVAELLSVTRVDITKDLHYAKVYISIIGTDIEKQDTLHALQQAAGFIAARASKQVVIRHFPELQFKIDDSAEKHMRIENLLQEIQEERQIRENPNDSGN